MSTPVLPPYVPPVGDEPLDAVELAIVNLWIHVIADVIRAELKADDRSGKDAIEELNA
jgi:hypothetical protein